MNLRTAQAVRKIRNDVAIRRRNAHIGGKGNAGYRGAGIFAPVEKEMPSWTQILLVVVLILLLFGRGKISGNDGRLCQGHQKLQAGAFG